MVLAATKSQRTVLPAQFRGKGDSGRLRRCQLVGEAARTTSRSCRGGQTLGAHGHQGFPAALLARKANRLATSVLPPPERFQAPPSGKAAQVHGRVASERNSSDFSCTRGEKATAQQQG